MIKEYFSQTTIEDTIKIEDSKIHSFKNKNILQKSVRVFDDKNKIISLAAAKGEVADADLEKKAIDLLSLQIPYDYTLENDVKGDFVKDNLGSLNLEQLTVKILDDLKEFSKDYVFTGKTSIIENTTNITIPTNDIALFRRGKYLHCSLSMKLKGSGNISDAYIGFGAFGKDIQEYSDFLKDTEFLSRATMSQEVNLEDKTYHILCDLGFLINKFYQDINGIQYEEKTSLLAGKLNELIFHDSINIYETTNYEKSLVYIPFDHECMLRTDDLEIVKNGVLQTILYDKKNAKKYGKKSTGNGYRVYNNHPSIANYSLISKGKYQNTSDLISNDYVIVPFVYGGGDVLPNGNYSQPVQLAFVYQNGKFLGKAPQLTLTGNYLDALNKDFVAMGNNDLNKTMYEEVLVLCRSKVNL